MDIGAQKAIEPAQDAAAADRSDALLNTMVAITVALLATFSGICKVKDDNIVQAMQQAQADKLDHWNFYQARNVRQDVAEAAAVQLRLGKLAAPGAAAAAYDEAIAQAEAKAAGEARKKAEVKAQAEQDQKNYDQLNYRDDQFDLSDAALDIAIALLAVTALTKAWWMYWLAWLPLGFGVVMGLAGLLGWAVHPATLAGWLS